MSKKPVIDGGWEYWNTVHYKWMAVPSFWHGGIPATIDDQFVYANHFVRWKTYE
jgi:hypothetical protein